MTRLLSTYIFFNVYGKARGYDFDIYVDSVPVEHLASFPDRLRTSLARIAEKGLDMGRMSMLIRSEERQFRSDVESSKGSIFLTPVIGDFLYGPEDGSELRQALSEINNFEVVKKWSSKQWSDLLKRLRSNAHYLFPV